MSALPTTPNAGEKTLIVLEAAVRERRFTDIVAATGLSKSSVHRILQMLVDYGYLAITESARYHAGPRTLSVAAVAFREIDIAELAQPIMRRLCKQVGEQVHIGARNGFDAIYVALKEPDKPYHIQMPSSVGTVLHLHCTALGKSILAAFTEDEFEAYIAATVLVRNTPHTITDASKLRAVLQTIRERGYALDDEENVPGIRCVAAPIRNSLGRTTHALSISSLSLEHTIDEVAALAPQTIAAAEEICAALGGGAAA